MLFFVPSAEENQATELLSAVAKKYARDPITLLYVTSDDHKWVKELSAESRYPSLPSGVEASDCVISAALPRATRLLSLTALQIGSRLQVLEEQVRRTQSREVVPG